MASHLKEEEANGDYQMMPFFRIVFNCLYTASFGLVE